MNKFGLKTWLVALAAMVAIPAMAQTAEPDEVIKYRKYVMGTVGNHTQAFFAILKGKVPHQDALVYHARSLADAAAHTKAAFEQNTAGQGVEKTTSKENVWSGPEFMAGLDDMVVHTEALASAMEAGDMAGVGAAAGEVGKTCKSCHDKFRSEHH